MFKKSKRRRLTAVGAYIFAGGFTVGVKRAGFDVLMHLEGDGGYGVSTFEANFPEVPVHHGPSEWPMAELERLPTIDLIYGNPPCAAWSGNNANSHHAGRWKDDPRVSCVRHHFDLLRALSPRAWAWESVTQAPDKGKELVDELTGEAIKLGYGVTQVFVDAKDVGTPQTRKRWFMVCHKGEFNPSLPGVSEVSAAEMLSRVEPEGPPAYDVRQNSLLEKHLHLVPPGTRLRGMWGEFPHNSGWSPGNSIPLGFGHIRLRTGGPASATVGYAMVHPTEDRFLCVNEVAALAGFPDEYEFVGGVSGAAQLDVIAMGVCPPVGEWLAKAVRDGLGVKGKFNRLREVRTVNLIKIAAKTKVRTTSPSGSHTIGGHNKMKGKLGHPGSKPQDAGRRYDVTQLKESGHGRLVHRDYAAHFFRWGWASRFIKGGKTRVLDVGCGQDLPLVKILTASLSVVPKVYVGVDLNECGSTKIRWVGGLHSHFDFVSGWQTLKREHGTFDLVACFEVIEHMHAGDGRRLLAGLVGCLSSGGKILLSTPVYDGKKMAANHLHEWTVKELIEAVNDSGLRAVGRFGTFASWNDVRKVCSDQERKLLDTVGRFYGGEVLACFLAPKYPDASRNNVWVLEREGD